MMENYLAVLVSVATMIMIEKLKIVRPAQENVKSAHLITCVPNVLVIVIEN